MKSEEAKIQQEQQQAPIKYEATRVLPPQSDIIDVLYYYDSILPLDQKLFDQEAVMIASRVAKFRNKCDRLRKNIDHRIAAIVDTMDSENLNRILKQELGALYKHISFNFKGVIEDLKFNHNYDFTFPNKVINYKDFNKVYDNLKYLEKKVNEAIGEGIDHPAAIDKEGMCYGLTSIWLWNKRQEDIGNTTDKGNPTRIMNEVFTKITRKPKNLNNEDRKDVEILINYLLATQNSHYIAKELNLIDIADKIDKKYSRHKKDSDRVTQGLYLVDPSGDIRNPMIQRVFNKDLLKCKLKDLDYILQPGVLLESSTRDHAMGCYMDGDKNIFFYDPNDGKEVKFDDIDELKKYLTSGKMVANYFSDGEFRPRISIVNYGTAQKYKVEKYYSDLEKLLNQNTPNEKLQYNSSEIKDICIQELRESKILYAIKNNKTIEGEDATVYAFDIGLEIEGKNAITYAVDNNIKIRDTDPTV
ncbi:MAG: hypothetical protein K9G11_00610, partial [Rickettsiaceae bacterium]|nr:hypothetical protein [Rickettsiaceae bacterium]